MITETPLIQRKNFLTNTIVENDKISVSRFIENNGIELFNLAKQNKLEGVVGKGRNSLYWFGKRSHDWKKIKVMEDYEAIAIGYIHKPNNMTSLILAQYDDDQNLNITNHVTLGVSLSKLKQQGLKESSCPLRIIPKGHDNAIWIKPLACTVEYMPSEKEGLRQAVFKGIRTDKSPEECVKQ